MNKQKLIRLGLGLAMDRLRRKKVEPRRPSLSDFDRGFYEGLRAAQQFVPHRECDGAEVHRRLDALIRVRFPLGFTMRNSPKSTK